MGEMAEMMLEGILCEACGVYIDDDGDEGFPRYCSRRCAADRGVPWGDPEPSTRAAKREKALAQSRAAPMGKKRRKWLTEAAREGSGMYPGCHADAAPGVFRDLKRLGFVKLYVPHNSAHKDRYVATEAGRQALAQADSEGSRDEPNA